MNQAPAAPAPRVAVLISSYYPTVGGGESHARLLCRQLRQDGAAPLVVTRRRLRDSPAFERVDGTPVYRVPPPGVPRLGKYLMLLPALRCLLRLRDAYDVVYVCGLRVLGVIGVRAARQLGKPCVLRAESAGELSGAFIWDNPLHGRSAALHRLFRGPVRLRNGYLRRADHFVSISESLSAEFAACGVPPERITRIPNGIDTAAFAPATPAERRALRARLGLPEAARVFCYSGKLNRGKGLEFLVEAWRQLAAARPDPPLLVLVGGGGQQALGCEAALRAQVARHGLAASVVFTGYVNNVADYLRAADGFLFPSESEALPMALLEAMACGLPVLASPVGGIPEVVRDGIDGRLAPVGDAAAWQAGIRDFMDRPAAAETLARAGRARVCEQFGIERAAAEHLRLFRRLAAARHGRTP